MRTLKINHILIALLLAVLVVYLVPTTQADEYVEDGDTPELFGIYEPFPAFAVNSVAPQTRHKVKTKS